MKICVVGGGAAGIFATKQLLKDGHAVTIFERSREPFGKVRTHFLPTKAKQSYVRTLERILNSKNLTFKPSVEVKSLKELENDFDAFVIATGSVANDESSDKVVRWYNGEKNGVRLGKNVAILGMGAVSMDIVRMILTCEAMGVQISKKVVDECNKVVNLVVFSGKAPFNATFKNSQIQELNSCGVALKTNVSIEKEWCFFRLGRGVACVSPIVRKLKDRSIFNNKLTAWICKLINKAFPGRVSDEAYRRYVILKEMERRSTNARLALNFMCDTSSFKRIDKGFDTVIRSAGYSPVRSVIEDTSRPTFAVGSCSGVKGGMHSIYMDAVGVAGKISALKIKGKEAGASSS